MSRAQLLRNLARILEDLADEEERVHISPPSADRKTSAQPRLFSVPGAAEYLGVSKGTIYRMLRENELPSIQLGSMRRIDLRDLERWIDEQKTRTTTTAMPYTSLPPIYPKRGGRKKS